MKFSWEEPRANNLPDGTMVQPNAAVTRYLVELYEYIDPDSGCCTTKSLRTRATYGSEVTNGEIRGLRSETRYSLHLRAGNAAGYSRPDFSHLSFTTAAGGSGFDSQMVEMPALAAARVTGSTLTLTYNMALDTNSTPANSDFAVRVRPWMRVDGYSVAVSGVSVSGRVVTLTLAGSVRHKDSVTMAYVPGSNPIRAGSGQDASALSSPAVPQQPVTNTTPASSDATLTSLSLSVTGTVPLSPAFAPHITSYTATVAHDDEWVVVDGTAGNDRADVLDGPVKLDAGSTPVRVVVTAENGSTRTYTVVVNRGRDPQPPTLWDATISGRVITLVFDEPLDRGSVPASGDFTVTMTDLTASTVRVSNVAVNGDTVVLTLAESAAFRWWVVLDYASGSRPIRDLGQNAFGSVSGWTVTNNTPASSDASLRSLSLGEARLNRSFTPGITSYTATVPFNVDQITVTAVTNDPNAEAIAHTTDLPIIGENTVAVDVFAEDGTMLTYTIIVTRSSN